MTSLFSNLHKFVQPLSRRVRATSPIGSASGVVDRRPALPDQVSARTRSPLEITSDGSRPSESVMVHVSIEGILWTAILILAIVTRFWDLSSRAQNHDESLHSYFSWLYYADYRYLHDPLMHGPALFHLNALAYFLFGDSDYVSRVVPAFLGVLIVMMPYLLRSPGLLGKWGALTASAILLFSPSILYYSRFIRHDVYVLAAAMAIVVFLLRYLEERRSRWLILTGIAAGFMFSTKEVSFIIAFVIVTFLVMVVSWQVHRALLGVAMATGLGLLAVIFGMSRMGANAFPTIPWEDPTSANIRQFTIDAAQHPITLASLGILGLGIVGLMMVVDRLRTPDGGGLLADTLGRAQDDTTTATLYSALRNRRALQIGIASGLILFVTLYTSLFTNMGGLGSATFGALGYWLGQHDVQRGDQPWFYYLLLLPQYEFFAVVIFPIAGFLTLRHIIPRVAHSEPVGRRWYFRGFLLYWATVMLVVLSWAGEKMPWLSIHVVAPMILLAASIVGEAIEYIEAQAREGRLPTWSAIAVGLGIPIVAGAWFLLWAWGTSGPWILENTDYVRTLRPEISDNPWILYIPLAAFAALVLLAVFRLGWRSAIAVLGVGAVAALFLAQVHVSYRFVYEEGDVAVDMLTYSQVSPDVPRVVDDIGEMSRYLTGSTDMEIYYDSGTSWPFQWYLRNYPNRRFFGTELTAPPNAPIVLISREYLTPENEAMLTGYTFQEYSMRWFFPEVTTYRRFAYAPELNNESRQNYQDDREGPYGVVDVARSVWNSLWSLRQPQQQAKMFRLVSYRELWTPISSSYDFRIYVRNDLADVFTELRY